MATLRIIAAADGEWYCAGACAPAVTDITAEDVGIVEPSLNDSGFTSYPVCKTCGRVHCWVLLGEDIGEDAEIQRAVTARDQNGLHVEAWTCRCGHLHDEHGEAYERAASLDDAVEVVWRNLDAPSDVLSVARIA